jgi:alpha-mannosidase
MQETLRLPVMFSLFRDHKVNVQLSIVHAAAGATTIRGEPVKRRELLKHLGMTAGALFSANAANPYAVAGADDATSNDLLHPIRGLVRRHGALFQPIEIHLRPPEYALPMVIKVDGNVIDASLITRSAASLQALVSPADTVRQVTVSVEVNGATRTEQTTVKPVRRVQIYILPHSHHDLGYTDLQANVVERQMRNITLAIDPKPEN